MCLLDASDNWKEMKIEGVYSQQNTIGPQLEISVENSTKLLITLSKKDLRFSCGADIDNKHGLYLIKKDGTFYFFTFYTLYRVWQN